MAGIVTPDPLPKFPDGFPKVFIEEFSKRTGRKILCNLPYSGTQVIYDYGREQEETGALIVYTSADSVCQIAAHEEISEHGQITNGQSDGMTFHLHRRDRRCWMH